MYVVTHADDKQLKCAHCNYRTKIRSDLKKHIKKHSVQNSYACGLCAFRTNSIGRLMSHKLTHANKGVHRHAGGKRSLECSLCDYKTSCGSLKEHMKPFGFKCNESGGGVLKTYMSGQNDEQLFKCNLCDYRCKWSGTLKKHFSIEHAAKKC